MTTEQLTEILKSTPRTLTPEQVDQIGHEHDSERGEYVANQIVHHEYGESAR